MTEHAKYLGLPQLVGKGKCKAFSDLRQSVWKKLQGWNEKLLSQAGKEILIKAVALLIPTYTMCCFQLSHSLCNELGKKMSKFWWGQGNEKNKFIRLVGIRCVNPKKIEAWALRIYELLIGSPSKTKLAVNDMPIFTLLSIVQGKIFLPLHLHGSIVRLESLVYMERNY